MPGNDGPGILHPRIALDDADTKIAQGSERRDAGPEDQAVNEGEFRASTQQAAEEHDAPGEQGADDDTTYEAFNRLFGADFLKEWMPAKKGAGEIGAGVGPGGGEDEDEAPEEAIRQPAKGDDMGKAPAEKEAPGKREGETQHSIMIAAGKAENHPAECQEEQESDR